uniref:ABC transmembrane type-2 domain-containing protein n=1 Tax=uncultured bacterium fosmid pJB69A5 TaxID=1478067 RepID=A0A0H3U9R6_9BACT|nr:hypothetical protein [uncultured bacterium fosmid pJB69A5]
MTTLYLIQKEFKQILRNWLLPVVFVILPLALINGVPRIASQEVKGLHFCVVDNVHTPTTERLIREIDASQYIDLAAYCTTYDEAMKFIDSGEADIIVEFRGSLREPQGKLGSPTIPDIMLYANATNGMKGGMASMYIQQIIQSSKVSEVHLRQSNCKYINNPLLDYKLYMVPALIGMVLVLIVGFLPALNIVSEKEKGTIEQINVTPIRKWEFIVSKIVPYIIIGLFMVLEALLVARGVFGFWPQGSLVLVFVFVFVFCLLISSFGLIVSNYSNTLSQAALTMFFFLVVFLLMSGLLTPIQSMPDWAQKITLVNPLRYFCEAMRGIYIKGATITDLLTQFSVLILYSTFTWTWAIISYRKNG